MNFNNDFFDNDFFENAVNTGRSNSVTTSSTTVNGVSFEELSRTNPQQAQKVRKQMEKLVEAGLMPASSLKGFGQNTGGVQADMGGGAFSNNSINGISQNTQSAAPEPAPALRSGVYTCPNCGAINNITDGRNECEYCGSPIAAK
ncbi:hypothetical protein MUJ63_00405 [Lachnospiraceae bacterium NSJ-143]|nr:hypothetical protein [Lachnospiraceae bacterium NSJ-143]